jgi:hypothetical protein
MQQILNLAQAKGKQITHENDEEDCYIDMGEYRSE